MQWGRLLIDSTTGQPDPLPYNLAKWNGSSWQLKKVTVNFRGYPVTTPIDGIFAFSPTDIWLVAGDPIHGDGKNWSDFDIRNITGDQNIDVLKGWGTSSIQYIFCWTKWQHCSLQWQQLDKDRERYKSGIS